MVAASLSVKVGTQGNPIHIVQLERVEKNLTVKCDCSIEEKICNHIISALFGEESKIINCHGNLTKKIEDMLLGSDVEHAFGRLRELTNKSNQINLALSQARLGLGEAIKDFKPFSLMD